MLTLELLKKEHCLDLKPKSTKSKTLRTIRAIARYENRRILVHDAESFNHHSGHKSDAFGILDAIVKDGQMVRGIQACGADWAPHIDKLKDHLETVELWLMGECTTLELWGWRKVKRRGRQVYRPKIQLITVEFLKGIEKKPYMIYEDLAA